MKVHEVALVHQVYFTLHNRAHDGPAPGIETIERVVRAVLEVLKIPIAPDGLIEYQPGAPKPDAADQRVLELARLIGAHWRDQEGVNAALIDELAEACGTP